MGGNTETALRGQPTILLLAGDRDGGILIGEKRIRKALLRVGERSLLQIALEKLLANNDGAAIHVLANDVGSLLVDPECAAVIRNRGVRLHDGQGSPVESLLDWRRKNGGEGETLILTVDTPLVRTETLEEFIRDARRHHGDLAVGVVERATLWSRFPGMKRSFFRLRDGRFKGGNLFFVKTSSAWRAIERWRDIERDRKAPWKLLRRMDGRVATLALLGRLSLSRLFEEASRVLQTRAIAIRLHDAGLAADIDTTAHLHAVQSKVMREQKQAEGVKVTAVFDLDRTITRFGTYTPFLLFCAWHMGKRRLLCLPIVLGLMGLYRVGLLERGRLKELMFEFLLGPTSLERLRPHIDTFASFVVRRGLRPGAVAALAYEKENGARIMMATAALDIYARAIADRLGIEDVIASVMRIEAGSVAPVIESGNCYGEQKWARIHQALIGPVHIVFYTDDASDLPTLTQVSEGFVVNPKPRFSKIAHHLGMPVLKW